MLNLHKLDVFLQVAQTGSFSRAGESLIMTQSAVSHHMRDLERHLGTQLFRRHPRGVTLTDEGKALQEYGLRITSLIAEAEQVITNISNLESGAISVGATPGLSVYLLPDCIFLFQETYPKLSVAMQTGTSASIIERLQANQIDLGIIEGELEEDMLATVHVQMLHPIEQKVIIGRKHGWWDREGVSLAELDGQEFVMRQPNSQTRIWLDKILAEKNIHPRVSTVFDSIDSIKRAVIRGTCLTIMPEYTVQDELEQGVVQALPVEGKPLQRTLKIVKDAGKTISPTANGFLAHIEECLLSQKLPL